MNQLHSEARWQDCVFHFGQDWSWKLVNKNYTMKLLSASTYTCKTDSVISALFGGSSSDFRSLKNALSLSTFLPQVYS